MEEERNPCAAAIYGRQLEDRELLLLIAIFSLPKTRNKRVFHEDVLKNHSVRAPLEERGFKVHKVLKKLVSKGFLDGGGVDHLYRATGPGNCVKHQFHFHRGRIETRGTRLSTTRSLQFIPDLRREVWKACQALDPAWAAQIDPLPDASRSEEE